MRNYLITYRVPQAAPDGGLYWHYHHAQVWAKNEARAMRRFWGRYRDNPEFMKVISFVCGCKVKSRFYRSTCP